LYVQAAYDRAVPAAPSGRQRVIDATRARIADGTYPPGSALPTKRAIATEFVVSLGTVNEALLVLKAEGLVKGRQGVAVFVVDPDAEDA
jgi:GntR family transcriptional regulator